MEEIRTLAASRRRAQLKEDNDDLDSCINTTLENQIAWSRILFR